MVAGVSFYDLCFTCRAGRLDQVVFLVWPYVYMQEKIQVWPTQTCASDSFRLNFSDCYADKLCFAN